MKTTILSCLLFFFPFFLFSQELNILSLNNSLIDYNDQPVIFDSLTLSAGKTTHWVRQTHDGKTLRFHYEEGEDINAERKPTAKKKVRSKDWDYIILQEQSTKPVTDYDDFLASVKLWVKYVKEFCPNPDAKIILMMNWPYVDSKSFVEDAEVLCANYKNVARELGVDTAPIGNAFCKVRIRDGAMAMSKLYADNRHPTVLGSYLSACVMYAFIYNESPIGLNYSPTSITADDARRMQERAWETHEAHRNETSSTNIRIDKSGWILCQR